MSSPDGDAPDTSTRDGDDAPAGPGAEWSDRHARVERHSSDRWVRAEPPGDDWDARHSRTNRQD